MQRAMFDTVDEVGRVAAEEGIDARFHKGGAFVQASNAPQLLRAQEEIEYERSWGFGEEDYRLLGAEEARSRIAATGSLGAYYTPHSACVDPARLARGLADVVEKLGVPIYERTPALRLAAGRVDTPAGAVTAEVVVRATEGYTVELPGFERALLPLYSLMIATEPLPSDVWDAIGWREHETFNDERFLIIYAMRTDDDRLAIGGRGAPYHWGSRVSDDFVHRAARLRVAQGHRASPLPADGRLRRHAHLGRAHRHPARLVQLRRARPRLGQGLGRRVRRRRRVDDEPLGAHAPRPDPRPRDRRSRACRG